MLIEKNPVSKVYTQNKKIKKEKFTHYMIHLHDFLKMAEQKKWRLD